jgi:hypothetical protein
MQIKANGIKLQYNESGKAEVVLSTDLHKIDISEAKEIISKGKELAVEIKQYRQKRSLEANDYCWVICQKIAEVIRTTKEEVYKRAIRQVGQFEMLAVKAEAAEQFIKVWNARGLGWFAEQMDNCKIEGCAKIVAYYGSSVYDTRAMWILISEIVIEAKELGIETLPPDELERLKQEWGNQ